MEKKVIQWKQLQQGKNNEHMTALFSNIIKIKIQN